MVGDDLGGGDFGADDMGGDDLGGDDFDSDDMGGDDLGGDDLLDGGMDDAPAGDEPSESPGGDLDDLFGGKRPAAGATVSRSVRTWMDNTGKYQTEAKLVHIAIDHIKLLKSNGKISTVPLRRLSVGDFDYVQMQASLQGLAPLNRLAKK